MVFNFVKGVKQRKFIDIVLLILSEPPLICASAKYNLKLET